jgi:hypothetical protein
MLVVKQMSNFSYRVLIFHIADSGQLPGGIAGVHGQDFQDIESQGRGKCLGELAAARRCRVRLPVLAFAEFLECTS